MIEKYHPGKQQVVQDLKERFATLNEFISARNGWVVSVPGAVEVTVETLPNSTLPDELRQRGYHLVDDGEAERILPSAIIEKLVVGPDGRMEPLTAGSTRPVSLTTRHAGIVRTRRHTFDLP